MTFPYTPRQKQNDQAEMLGNVLLLLVVVALLGGALSYGYGQQRLARRCLAAGYPYSRWSLTGPNYCVKRLDNSDVVVPVENAR